MSLEPLAEELRRLDHHVLLPDLTPTLTAAGDYAAVQAETVAAGVDRRSVSLLAHSGAGPLVPLVAQRLTGRGVPVAASVLIDAALPHPGRSTVDVLPTETTEQLRAMAADGEIPPWPSWWTPEQLETLVPDPRLRQRLIDDCPRLPTALFTEVHPHADDPDLGRRSYLHLSGAYDSAAEHAAAAGWSVDRIDAHHLAVLTAPADIAGFVHHVT